jgi:hypothetical protein
VELVVEPVSDGRDAAYGPAVTVSDEIGYVGVLMKRVAPAIQRRPEFHAKGGYPAGIRGVHGPGDLDELPQRLPLGNLADGDPGLPAAVPSDHRYPGPGSIGEGATGWP